MKKLALAILAFITLCGFNFFNTCEKQKENAESLSLCAKYVLDPNNFRCKYDLSSFYAVGWGVKQDIHKSLILRQEVAEYLNEPMYSLKPPLSQSALNPFSESTDSELRYLVNRHNGLFKNKIIELEKAIIEYLKPYNSGLGVIAEFYIEAARKQSLGLEDADNRPMANNNGSASLSTCQLDSLNIMPLILYMHPSDKKPVVVDIGSGWGACSQQLALLGYKVFSIDPSPYHLQFQKDNFCISPSHNTFIHQYWKVNNPKMLEEKTFNEYCKKIKENNIKFVLGEFTDQNIRNIITEEKWDIVLSLDSVQFMHPSDQYLATELVKRYLQSKGIFVLKTKRKKSYASNSPDQKYIFDYDLYNSFHKTFFDYKILNVETENNGGNSAMTFYKE